VSRSDATRTLEAVVVGASAGGVEALIAVLPALLPQAQVPVAVVLHLPGHQPSLLVEIFSPLCALPVCEVMDKQSVEAGTIYFAAPNYHLLIERERSFALSLDEAVQFSRPSIDVLFESAAAVYGRKLAAVLLTGAGTDGAAGMAAVQAAGGLTVVQDPATAYAASMPHAALERIVPDYCLSLPNIALFLRSLNSGAVNESALG
jgi:two-component system chemotaxis response regulator CheB